MLVSGPHTKTHWALGRPLRTAGVVPKLALVCSILTRYNQNDAPGKTAPTLKKRISTAERDPHCLAVVINVSDILSTEEEKLQEIGQGLQDASVLLQDYGGFGHCAHLGLDVSEWSEREDTTAILIGHGWLKVSIF